MTKKPGSGLLLRNLLQDDAQCDKLGTGEGQEEKRGSSRGPEEREMVKGTSGEARRNGINHNERKESGKELKLASSSLNCFCF